MILMHTTRTLMMIAAAVTLGCSTEAPVPEPEPETNRPWYENARTLDLTGDGRADSVHLEAVGTRPDSLAIALTILVDGVEKHREEWGSSYEVMMHDTVGGPARLDALVRASLDTVLASVIVEPLSAPSVRLMAEDSAILAGVRPPPTHRISFAYGYETTVRLVWDAPGVRFVRLWSCC